MDRRARTTLILAVVAQAAVSVVQFGLPAIGLEVRDKFDLGPAGFGAVFAAVGLGSAVALIGGCGLNDFEAGKSHRAEVGYWLAKPLWGRGIMTAAVQRVCQHAFEEFGLLKITAHVFIHNSASARVLEKCGFQQEGFLRKHFLKDGRFIDGWLFALLKGE